MHLQESGPRGLETRPPSFFSWRLQRGLSVFQWGSNPHNPPPPPANFYPDTSTSSSTSSISSSFTAIPFCLHSQLNRKFTVTKCLSKNRELLSWCIAFVPLLTHSLSRIDYCNAVLHGAPADTVSVLQRVQNNTSFSRCIIL